MSNSCYIVPGVVDGQVMHKQAWRRLNDTRSGPEVTYVHHHTHREDCNEQCTIYHVCVTTHLPNSHPLEQSCPQPEVEEADAV